LIISHRCNTRVANSEIRRIIAESNSALERKYPMRDLLHQWGRPRADRSLSTSSRKLSRFFQRNKDARSLIRDATCSYTQARIRDRAIARYEHPGCAHTLQQSPRTPRVSLTSHIALDERRTDNAFHPLVTSPAPAYERKLICYIIFLVKCKLKNVSN